VIRGAARLTQHSHAARGNERDMIRDIHYAEIDLQIPFHDVDMMEGGRHEHYAKYLEIVLCVTFSSFLRAAWECSPGALRPEARRI